MPLGAFPPIAEALAEAYPPGEVEALISLSDPVFILKVLAFTTGICFGQAGKHFDWEVQQTQRFKQAGRLVQWFIKLLLNVTHHFQWGLILMYSALRFWQGDLAIFMYWFGLALVVDDLPDLTRRLKKWWGLFK